jgi:hypothetical protein
LAATRGANFDPIATGERILALKNKMDRPGSPNLHHVRFVGIGKFGRSIVLANYGKTDSPATTLGDFEVWLLPGPEDPEGMEARRFTSKDIAKKAFGTAENWEPFHTSLDGKTIRFQSYTKDTENGGYIRTTRTVSTRPPFKALGTSSRRFSQRQNTGHITPADSIAAEL